MKAIFSALIMLCAINSAIAQDTTFLFNDTWSFDNFTRPANTLTWEKFRQNFIGIPPTQSDANPFEQVMFEEVYQKELYPPGHCFGMDLMALQLLKYGGYAGYCSPASQHGGTDMGPIDPGLELAIQMQHGRQIGHRFLMHILDVIAVNKQRDGNYVYSQFLYYQSKKEPCILSVTKGITPADGGHALVPYYAEDLGSIRRIYVYDVNRSFHMPDDPGTTALEHRGWYIGGENYVEIDKSTGEWKFFFGSTLWSGNPSSGGNLVLFPFSIMNVKDRLPQSLFADAAEALGKIFIYADGGDLHSIKTPDNRTLQLPADPCFDESQETTLHTVYPFVPINGGTSLAGNGQLFFLRGENHFDLTVAPGAKGLDIQLFTDYHVITLQSACLDYPTTISVQDFFGPNPSITTDHSDIEIDISLLSDLIE